MLLRSTIRIQKAEPVQESRIEMKNNRVKAWAMTNGANILASSKRTYWNPQDSQPCEIVFNGGWIHTSERRPTKRDADKHGRILVWNIVFERAETTDLENYAKYFNLCPWQPCPKALKKGRRKE